jgi:WD40 repeat protein
METRTLGSLGRASAVTALAFDTRGPALLSGSVDGTVRVWALDSKGNQIPEPIDVRKMQDREFQDLVTDFLDARDHPLRFTGGVHLRRGDDLVELWFKFSSTRTGYQDFDTELVDFAAVRRADTGPGVSPEEGRE